MRHTVKYGKGNLSFDLPDDTSVTVFEPRHIPSLVNPLGVFERALDAPEGCPRLEDFPAPASVAIAVPDETRPFPTSLLLPPLLKKIFKIWPALLPDHVCVVVGGGLHEPPDAAQLKRILPDDLYGCRVVSHDARKSEMIRLGTTARGTPVEINAAYARAELKIVMGMVDAHQFVGFTGGAKGVVVGCASATMIEKNHSMLKEPCAFAGNLEENPVRIDLNEAGRIAGVKLAVNVSLDAQKNIAALFVGDPPTILRSAARKTRELYGMELRETFDIVIASCGGSPKDICLYQAQKALDAARRCAGKNGKILLVAECAQGIGDERYLEYARNFSDHASLLRDFENQTFRMGAHKAYLFSRVAATHEIVLHTALSQEDLASCLLNKGNLQVTLSDWLTAEPEARIALITNANATFFF
ncbi:MAG: nickel-dependent lactate racemase [Desulfovibrio fairfieldensis]|uniref:nickel-dependent lactate racemase n=1 Tax=Desulfovibrio sp. 6_1_46AFAA TaxID=665942 RepID=UPI0001E12681|nr:nickel-dependent lactate racemase [Desulfovibrio sp. 6_1_46AFAA]EFL86940.1 hypothetical protein HMPREF0326_00714 [Desulfovibrio sp. 3_1_syn3]EGW50496.1 hypothetical protein HMPREF1022_02455 [Desulfovibrio sp. 6_1_46AFAA]MEE0814563.1 nickel-dependent lactate racemase [Desulfovibrio fairfieldensis]